MGWGPGDPGCAAGRGVALGLGQGSLESRGQALGWGGRRGYFRASRWEQTWEKTLSTEPSALTLRTMPRFS